MNAQAKKAEQVVKLFFLELSLAKDTAYEKHFSRDPHVIWHCFQPYLGQRNLSYVRSGIVRFLIPGVEQRPDWVHILPMLKDGLRILNHLDDEYRQGCQLCRSEGRL